LRQKKECFLNLSDKPHPYNPIPPLLNLKIFNLCKRDALELPKKSW